MKQVLGPKVGLWLIPISFEMEGGGNFYPKIPDLELRDLKLLLKDVSEANKTQIMADEFESDP